MIRPLVSVIIPTFNSAHYLERSLGSVVQQTYKNWEAIIIDNNSIDNTEEVVKSFNDDRIKLQTIQNRGIIAVSRNLAIKLAKGEWLAFLDADDIWEFEKLSEVEKYFAQGDLIYHDMKIDYQNNNSVFQKKILKGRKLKKPVMNDLLLGQNPISNSSVVIKTSLIKQIGGLSEDPAMVGCEDYNTWLRIARITNRFTYIAKSLGTYTVHSGNFSNKLTSDLIKSATNEFIGCLTPKDRKKLKACEIYTKIKLANGSEKISIKEIGFCIFSARLDVALKAVIGVLRLMYRKIISS